MNIIAEDTPGGIGTAIDEGHEPIRCVVNGETVAAQLDLRDCGDGMTDLQYVSENQVGRFAYRPNFVVAVAGDFDVAQPDSVDPGTCMIMALLTARKLPDWQTAEFRHPLIKLLDLYRKTGGIDPEKLLRRHGWGPVIVWWRAALLEAIDLQRLEDDMEEVTPEEAYDIGAKLWSYWLLGHVGQALIFDGVEKALNGVQDDEETFSIVPWDVDKDAHYVVMSD